MRGQLTWLNVQASKQNYSILHMQNGFANDITKLMGKKGIYPLIEMGLDVTREMLRNTY